MKKLSGVIKVLLIVAAVAILYRLLAGKLPLRKNVPQPFDGEWYDDEQDADDDVDDEAADDDVEEDFDDEEEDFDDEEEDFDDEEEDFDDDYTAAAPSKSGGLFNVSADLLPKPGRGRDPGFGEFAPSALQGQSFLDATKFVGVNTQGSSLRNANHDLRSVPTIPRQDVGPWQQSTIEADLLRKPLE